MKTSQQISTMIQVINSGNRLLREKLKQSENWTEDEMEVALERRAQQVFDHIMTTSPVETVDEIFKDLVDKRFTYFD